MFVTSALGVATSVSHPMPVVRRLLITLLLQAGYCQSIELAFDVLMLQIQRVIVNMIVKSPRRLSPSRANALPVQFYVAVWPIYTNEKKPPQRLCCDSTSYLRYHIPSNN